MGKTTGVDAYREKSFIRISYIHVNHRIIKTVGWALAYTQTLYMVVRLATYMYYFCSSY